ncbi:MAG TPA: HAD family hydrolase [Acidimicrobiales bacterium]|nr:HAD family hydrolase [Acidimicrobiales bacterium]
MDNSAEPSSSDIKLACIDMAGTVVRDDGIVLAAFETAMRKVGASDAEIESAMTYVHRTMGLPKAVVFRALLGEESRVQDAVRAFDSDVLSAVEEGRVEEIEGAGDSFEALRSMGVQVCLTTGFTTEVQAAIVRSLGWSDAVDLSLAPGEGIRGRPYPDLILSAILRLEVDDVRQVAVVGDTANDLLSGHRAGSGIVAGVLTGTHGRHELSAAPHTHILDSIADFPALCRPGA